MTEQFNLDELYRLVHLGLREQAKFYSAEYYNDLKVLKTKLNGQLLCSYNKVHDRGYHSLMFMLVKKING